MNRPLGGKTDRRETADASNSTVGVFLVLAVVDAYQQPRSQWASVPLCSLSEHPCDWYTHLFRAIDALDRERARQHRWYDSPNHSV